MTDTPDGARPCLHVGLPKAGSSTLQRNLFRHLDGIVYHALRRKGGRHEEEGDFGRLVRAFREGHALDLDVPSLRAALSGGSTGYAPAPSRGRPTGAAADVVVDETAAEPADERPVLVSEERFATHYGLSMREKPRLLREVFGPARILLVVRHPAALMRSSYYQELRHPRYARATPPSLARWVDEALAHRHHALSPYPLVRFDWTIDAFAAAFGREAIHVVPLEWMRDAPERFARAVAAAIGVDADTVATTLARHAEPRNVRPATALAGLSRVSFRHPGKSLQEALAARRANADGAAERRAFARLVESVARPLRRLEDDHDLPIRALGYDATPPSG